jgi:hypothetical protein
LAGWLVLIRCHQPRGSMSRTTLVFATMLVSAILVGTTAQAQYPTPFPGPGALYQLEQQNQQLRDERDRMEYQLQQQYIEGERERAARDFRERDRGLRDCGVVVAPGCRGYDDDSVVPRDMRN